VYEHIGKRRTYRKILVRTEEEAEAKLRDLLAELDAEGRSLDSMIGS
jgi:hypothetical protein